MQDVTPFLDLLRCPHTGQPLTLDGDALVTNDRRYPLTSSGVPLFAETPLSQDARRQQLHYAHVQEAYLDNLAYPHTDEYSRFIDGLLLQEMREPIGTLVELCCGRGEAVRLPGLSYRRAIGIDIAQGMLESGRPSLSKDVCLLQGDATQAPLRDGCADAVFSLGGVHHVSDRGALFREVARLLRPGGRFYWREPVSDFLPWRMARAAIYRLSPHLDARTESPLRYETTVPVLERVGLQLETWRTCGFVAWCVLMNSDVLVANRLLRHLPGARRLTRLAARFDDTLLGMRGMERKGTQVIGVARKPCCRAGQRVGRSLAQRKPK